MPNTFYPKRSLLISASKPHPENTQYKVSIGEEDWDGALHTVIKIQLVYNGKIAGRKAPSYPYNSDDAERVAEAIAQIKKEYNEAPNVQYIPDIPMTEVPVGYYIALLRLVPPGCITRWEDIEASIKVRLDLERITPAFATWPYQDGEGNEIPYWRVVGPYGYLFSRSDKYTLEHQERLLIAEGLPIEPCGAGNKSRRVREYKKHLFDFRNAPDNIFDNIAEYKRPGVIHGKTK
ncbi:MAG: MGMT family protein [Oscillospiraceae bacterium]|nr:MGMT family protein [Oscillospiraceae bacterium]